MQHTGYYGHTGLKFVEHFKFIVLPQQKLIAFFRFTDRWRIKMYPDSHPVTLMNTNGSMTN